jgi:hypothetical protein
MLGRLASSGVDPFFDAKELRRTAGCLRLKAYHVVLAVKDDAGRHRR